MERDEFLKSLGLGLALVCTGSCFQSCSKSGDDDNEPNPNPGGSNTVSVDLSQRLLNVGDQFTASGVLFFRTAAGNQAASFVATEALCPHQGGTLEWQQANNRIECQLHFSRYESNGAIQRQPQGGGSTRALRIYAVTVNGNTLTATKA
jgi:cytochrome b6-f complex iron-sulfur subunit